MSRTSFVICLLIILALPVMAAEAPVERAHFPALSPDGSTLVFSYLGDLLTKTRCLSATPQQFLECSKPRLSGIFGPLLGCLGSLSGGSQ